MIPESFIQDLLSRTDIVELIDGYVHLKKSGANYMACCPFHNEKTPSFTVSPGKQFYHCFGCGVHGTAIGFLMAYQGQGFIDAVKELASRAGMQVPETREGVAPYPEDMGRLRRITDVMAIAAGFYKQQLKTSQVAIDYLKERGLSGQIAARFGLGYAPEGWQNLAQVFDDYESGELLESGLVIENEENRRYDRFRNRVMFPILNARGEVIAFGGRVIGEGKPKYLNSPETPLFQKGNELFGLSQAQKAIREENHVIVVEGYMDVVALAQYDITNVVATLGTATTPFHTKKLLRLVDRVIYCFDGDEAGQKAAWRALENSLENLSDNKLIGFVFLPESEDPDSFVRKEGAAVFRQRVFEAMPLSDFLLRELGRRCNLLSAEGKARLIAEAKPVIARIQAPFLRLQLIKRLAQTSGFSQEEIERSCGLHSGNKRPPPPKAPRKAPSLARNLLRLILQQPGLAPKIPFEHLPESDETTLLQAIAKSISSLPPTARYANLREHLRGHPLETLLDALQGESIHEELTEAEIEQEFSAVMGLLRHKGQKADFSTLQAKARQFGIAGLSEEEKKAYQEALQALKLTRQFGEEGEKSSS